MKLKCNLCKVDAFTVIKHKLELNVDYICDECRGVDYDRFFKNMIHNDLMNGNQYLYNYYNNHPEEYREILEYDTSTTYPNI